MIKKEVPLTVRQLRDLPIDACDKGQGHYKVVFVTDPQNNDLAAWPVAGGVYLEELKAVALSGVRLETKDATP